MIRNWILSLSFVKQALLDAEIEAFPKAQKDILETMRDELDEKAEELSKEKLSKLLSPVDLRSVVTLDKVHGVVFIGGERATEGRLNNLKNEAEFFEQSDLWKLIHETPKELAQRSMFVGSLGQEVKEELSKGRSMLYTLSQQQNIVDVFKSFKK
jgi:hypothetical protein